MKIDFVDEVGDNDGLSAAKLETLTKDITSKLSKTAGTIEVILVSDDKIRKLNKKFRGKNTATDVLSFPQEKFEGAKRTLRAPSLLLQILLRRIVMIAKIFSSTDFYIF